MPAPRRRLLAVAAPFAVATLLALAASPALAQSCGGVDVGAPAGGTLISPDTGGMSCITLYDAVVTQQGQVEAAWDQGSLSGVTMNTYDAAGDLVESVDGSATTRYAYDTADQLTEVTDPSGHITRYMYDAAGDLTAVTDPLGRTTTYMYDDGRLASSGGPVLDITSTMYDGNGNLTQITDGAGTSTYSYDNGQMTMVEDPAGHTTMTTYDGEGQVIRETDYLGNMTTYTYDDGRMLYDTAPDLIDTTSYTYDSSGDVRTSTDSNGNTDLWYVHDVPEPASAALLAPALFLLWRHRRRPTTG